MTKFVVVCNCESLEDMSDMSRSEMQASVHDGNFCIDSRDITILHEEITISKLATILLAKFAQAATKEDR